jgi:hypothetical protein
MGWTHVLQGEGQKMRRVHPVFKSLSAVKFPRGGCPSTLISQLQGGVFVKQKYEDPKDATPRSSATKITRIEAQILRYEIL